jgi:hypothetical protein
MSQMKRLNNCCPSWCYIVLMSRGILFIKGLSGGVLRYGLLITQLLRTKVIVVLHDSVVGGHSGDRPLITW